MRNGSGVLLGEWVVEPIKAEGEAISHGST